IPNQGRTDNSWGPRAIGDHGAPVSLPKLKKSYEKGTRGISWGPLLTLGPRAVPEFPNGQSAPVPNFKQPIHLKKFPKISYSKQLSDPVLSSLALNLTSMDNYFILYY
ncbi:unnamed protein product, partial [Staurois parvus]